MPDTGVDYSTIGLMFLNSNVKGRPENKSNSILLSVEIRIYY
jgi:hypothetical protein